MGVKRQSRALEYQEQVRQSIIRAEVSGLTMEKRYERLIKNGILKPIEDEAKQKVCV